MNVTELLLSCCDRHWMIRDINTAIIAQKTIKKGWKMAMLIRSIDKRSDMTLVYVYIRICAGGRNEASFPSFDFNDEN